MFSKSQDRLSDRNLNLINLNLRYADKFERTKVFMTEDGNVWEGEIVFPSKDTDNVDVYFDTLNMDRYSLGETITHELALHGSHLENIIKDVKKGNNVDRTQKDHKALNDRDINNKAYQKYNKTMKQLIKINTKYEKDAKISNEK